MRGVAIAMGLWCCGYDDSSPSEDVGEVTVQQQVDDPGPKMVLVVSLSATRADALECYDDTDHWRQFVQQQLQQQSLTSTQVQAFSETFPQASTPVMCGLAEEGVRFQWALSHAPNGLSSYTSLMSGREPHRHRVVRNGYSIPEDVPLMAERFQAAGWSTVGVISNSSLSGDLGPHRGFQQFLDEGLKPGLPVTFLTAPEVTQRTLDVLDSYGDSEQDLFLFVQYSDAHMPWLRAEQSDSLAPESIRNQHVDPQYNGPIDGSLLSLQRLRQARLSKQLVFTDARQARALYLSQVSWIDQEIGRLLEGIQSRGWMDDSLIVVGADHGVALDDTLRLPYSYATSVDLTSIHIPLIFRGKGTLALSDEPLIIDQMTRLMDVAGTITSVAGLDASWTDGQNLSGHWSRNPVPERVHLAEATEPRQLEAMERWNNIPMAQAVVRSGLVLQKWPQQMGREMISAQQLYAVAAGQPDVTTHDPQGQIVPAAQSKVEELREYLSSWNQNAPGYRALERTTDPSIPSK